MGDVNVSGWVCVVCDIVKRVWESIKTHDLPPPVFNQTPDHSWTSAPRERLALCRSTSQGAKASTNNSWLLTETCSVLLLYLFCFFFFKPWQLWSVSQNTGKRDYELINTSSLKICFAFYDLTNKQLLTPQTDVKGRRFLNVCPAIISLPYTMDDCFPNSYFPPTEGWWSWHITCSVTCSPSPISIG